MLETLEAERRFALARRPALDRLTAPEREVELMLREALSLPPDRADIAPHDPEATREWARAAAARIRMDGARYRGVPPAPLWGSLASADDAAAASMEERARTGPEIQSSIQAMTGPCGMLDMETRDARASASSSKSGERDAEAGDPDAYASSKPSRQAGPHRREDATTVHQSEPAPRHDGQPGPGLMGTTQRATADDSPQDLPPAVWYDEWNVDRGTYLKRAAAVRLSEPHDEGGEAHASADEILRDHGALVRQIRHQFERLRARRMLLGRQRSGDDLDVAACVEALVERRIGGAPGDRLYVDSRPARRGLAIALLADTSGSTQTTVSDSTRVIDLERIALLLAAEALDALGDLYAVYSFAGKSANDVRLATLKRFDQRKDATVRQRIARIAPGGFTRLGAAVRHTTRELAKQSAGHRLLLILSDGRPNDIDAYQGTYGVEDSRQAIFEARASGIFPFCITVDAHASEYLPRIFGTAGHVVVRRPSQLPSALLTVVSALIRRG
jgi:nitric oxide reductase NorD protein